MKNNIKIHKSAIIETKNIGNRSSIWAFVHILKDVEIGEDVNICDHCFIENGVKIGNKVTIKCGVWLWDGVLVEDNVFIGPSVVFTNDLYPRSKNVDYQNIKTVLMEGCSVGANSTILAGVNVGKHSMIGAGSVVTKDVGNYELVYGNPAKHQGYVCKCGSKLIFDKKNSLCKCGLKYRFNSVNNIIEVDGE